MKPVRLMPTILSVFFAAALFFSCAQGRKKLYTDSFFNCFDTVTTLSAYAASKEEFNNYLAAAKNTLYEYHKLYDIYTDYEGINNIKTVNDRAGESVNVDMRIIDLLDLSIGLYDLTNGHVNVAMGSVLALWHDCRESAAAHPESASIPDRLALRAAAEHTDISLLHVDRDKATVTLADPDMRIDVGAIAKGYAAGKTAELLRDSGLESGILNVGGNTVTIGSRADGNDWLVGIQNPRAQSSEMYIKRIAASDMCVVTSGSYERYFELDGVRYHHIIDKDSLMPADRYLSVTVTATDSGLADALSTALFCMDTDSALALTESLRGVETCIVLADGSIVTSSGFEDYES